MKRNNLNRLGLTLLMLSIAACSAPNSAQYQTGDSSSTAAAATMGKISLSIKDATQTVIYSDAVSNSALQLTSGKTYGVILGVANPVAGASYKLQSTQTNVPNGAMISIPLQVGTNIFAVPANGQGDFAWKLVATAAGYKDVSKQYLASVQCASPTFSAGSLDATQLSVSSSGNNMYSFSAAGVIANANGMAPYTCAFDPTGTGVQDTAFGDCSAAVNAYVNYVGSRKVGLLVKDSCFTTFAVSKTLNLPATTPAMPGNVFIQGLVSNASGSVINDSRVDGVSYLATNTMGHNIVQPNYANGTFKIEALQNYGLASSVKFGVSIVVSGITDNLNLANMTGTISAANAQIQKVVYSTDQAGDAKPLVTLSTNSCVLSNQNARVSFISGQPCSGGQTGDQNGATVEVWGHYSCPAVSAAGASVKLEGDFDGYTQLVDNCSGGGGGGGGVAPITL